MCRYAFMTYKPHYACLACRKAFRRRLRSDIADPGPHDHPARCPQCGLLMASMGLDFKPPKQDDVKGWEIVAKLWEVGLTFHSCGCSGPGYRPRGRRELRLFLEKALVGYLATLRRHMEGRPPTRKGQEAQRQAVAVWRGHVAQLEAALDETA